MEKLQTRNRGIVAMPLCSVIKGMYHCVKSTSWINTIFANRINNKKKKKPTLTDFQMRHIQIIRQIEQTKTLNWNICDVTICETSLILHFI